MPNKPQFPTSQLQFPSNRPTSPPPPRSSAEIDPLESACAMIRDLRESIRVGDEWRERLKKVNQKLREENAALLDRISKYECPNCGETEQDEILRCHHDGDSCGVPECDYRHCNTCGHQFGHN